MPKVVDHDARRRDIANEVIRSAASRGIPGASMRAVAAAMGLSLGAVQHYFPNQQAMLAAATAELGRRRESRTRAALMGLGHPPSERDILRAAALSGIPMDDERRRESLAEIAFLGLAVGGDPTSAAGVAGLTDFFAGLISAAAARGAAGEGIDPHHEARTLWALTSSAAQGLLVGAADPERVVATLDYWLDRVVPAP
ncbi:TetR/AcrR family transcriptional regulator [Mariniluteicoccus endophyticus]